MQHSQLKNDSWQLEDVRLSQLRDKLTNGFPTLKEVYGSPLYGIKTGLNEAFVIDGETKKRLISQDPNSAELLKPFLEGKDLKKWHSQPRDLWLILIPKGWTQTKMGGLFDELKSWEWLKSNYSAIANWFEPFEKAAQKRCDKGDFWWELRACAYYDQFEKPQIVYPDLSQGSKFHLDTKNCLFPNTAYFIESDDDFLLGVLNAKVIWFFLKGISDAMRGGEWRIRLFSQNIERIPIPPAISEQKTKIGDLAQRCQTLSEARYVLENKIRRRLPDLGVVKVNQKLERWWLLDFKGFQDELKKTYKIEIPVKERGDWQEMLEDAISEREKLDLQIRLLESELNLLVYGLFNLTNEEIEMIEGER